MGDSEKKKFGDEFLGRLGGELNKPASVYGQSLFTGAGDATRNAWRQGTGFSNSLMEHGGLSGMQINAGRQFGDLYNGYGAADDGVNAELGRVGLGYEGAGNESNRAFGDVYKGYGALGDHNGLTGTQSRVQGELGDVAQGFGGLADNNGLTLGQSRALRGVTGLGSQYGDLGEAYDPDSEAYQTLRQGITDDTLASVNSMYGASGRGGSNLNYSSAAKGLGNALAGLDYGNMQNNINNKYRSLDSQRGIYGDTFGMGQTGVGNQMAGLTGRAGVLNSIFGNAQTGVGNQFGALAGQAGAANSRFVNDTNALAGRAGVQNSIFGNNMAALGGQAGISDRLAGLGQQGILNRQGALDALTRIGAAQDANRQGARLGDADLFDRRHNAELDRLGRLGGVFGGNGPVDATSEAPWWQQLAGYVAGNAGKAIGAGIFG